MTEIDERKIKLWELWVDQACAQGNISRAQLDKLLDDGDVIVKIRFVVNTFELKPAEDSKMDRDVERIIEVMALWFSEDGWRIDRGEKKVFATQASGYGSGPAVVDITALAQRLHEYRP